MRIGILGTGVVARTLAGALTGLGHDLVLGTRDPAATRDRDDDTGAWLREHPGVGLDTFAAAAAHGEVVVNATSGEASLQVVRSAGTDALAGKPLLDVANPLDFSGGFPPSLSVCNTDSLAEQIQRTAPDALVVKTLNTMTSGVMVEPASVGDGDTTVFVAGNDDAAKAVAAGLLRELGWRDIVDLGDLTGARGLEMWLPLWLRLMQTLGTPRFNLRIVPATGS